MLKPSIKTLEGNSALGSIAVAVIAAVSVAFPDSNIASMSPEEVIAGAKSAAELAEGLRYQLAERALDHVARYGFAGGLLVFAYKVWSRFATDRKELKRAEMEAGRNEK